MEVVLDGPADLGSVPKSSQLVCLLRRMSPGPADRHSDGPDEYGGAVLWRLPEITRCGFAKLDEPNTGVSSMAFSPDGTKLYTASSNGLITVWEIPDR
jgi:WD40 repeat protein